MRVEEMGESWEYISSILKHFFKETNVAEIWMFLKLLMFSLPNIFYY